MPNQDRIVLITQMNPHDKRRDSFTKTTKYKKLNAKKQEQLLRTTIFFTAASFCLGIAVIAGIENPKEFQRVMGYVDAGFDYDETLGRLQFVDNLLPESAMVFLRNEDSSPTVAIPCNGRISHAWNQNEPWFEYTCIGSVSSCMDGQVSAIVKNQQDRFTVRIMHQNGFESVYSGLHSVQVQTNTPIISGQQIGTVAGLMAFELRKDGLSVLPVFDEHRQ